MQIKRTASALWNGSGKEGKGVVSTASSVLSATPYSFHTRFEDGKGTNPEELIGAAHAACFSMKLAFCLQSIGVTAESIETTATVILENGTIMEVQLHTKVKASGLSVQDFEIQANDAKQNCPISKLFNATITLKAELI